MFFLLFWTVCRVKKLISIQTAYNHLNQYEKHCTKDEKRPNIRIQMVEIVWKFMFGGLDNKIFRTEKKNKKSSQWGRCCATAKRNTKKMRHRRKKFLPNFDFVCVVNGDLSIEFCMRLRLDFAYKFFSSKFDQFLLFLFVARFLFVSVHRFDVFVHIFFSFNSPE